MLPKIKPTTARDLMKFLSRIYGNPCPQITVRVFLKPMSLPMVSKMGTKDGLERATMPIRLLAHEYRFGNIREEIRNGTARIWLSG